MIPVLKFSSHCSTSWFISWPLVVCWECVSSSCTRGVKEPFYFQSNWSYRNLHKCKEEATPSESHWGSWILTYISPRLFFSHLSLCLSPFPLPHSHMRIILFEWRVLANPSADYHNLTPHPFTGLVLLFLVIIIVVIIVNFTSGAPKNVLWREIQSKACLNSRFSISLKAPCSRVNKWPTEEAEQRVSSLSPFQGPYTHSVSENVPPRCTRGEAPAVKCER